MTQLLLDYYVETENIHRLRQALCDQYIRYIKHCIREFQAFRLEFQRGAAPEHERPQCLQMR